MMNRRCTLVLTAAALVVLGACADSGDVTAPAATPAAPGGPSYAASANAVANNDSIMAELTNGESHRHILVPRQDANGLTSNNPINGKISYHGGFVIAGTDNTKQTAVAKVAVLYWSGADATTGLAAPAIYANAPAPGTCWNAGATTGACYGTNADNSLVGYFLNNLGGSAYFNINTTYYGNMSYLGGGSTNTYVQNVLRYSQYYADPNPIRLTNGVLTDSAMANELNNAFVNGNLTWDPTGATIYVIYTPSKVNAGGNFGTQYCAYHGHFLVTSSVTGGGVNGLYAVLPYDYDYQSACTGQGAITPNGDPAADAIVNTSAHEIEEAVTDGEGFRSPGWYDGAGNENADKCAWVWGTTTPVATVKGTAYYNQVLGPSSLKFLIQENWKQSGSCAQHL